MTQRIVSLLPSATEIVCALGARDRLVGRSHECDWPADVESLPVLTSARMEPASTSAAIDRSVRAVLEKALAVYEVDVAKLKELAPDVIVTQDLCDVCAVSAEDVRRAAKEIAGKEVQVVSLRPTHIDDIWADVQRVADAIGRSAEGKDLVASLRGRVESIRERAQQLSQRVDVVSIEWIEPVMLGGTWMPEILTIAGGNPLGVEPGQNAPTVDRAFLEEIDPEAVVVKPCGYSLARTLAELPRLKEMLPWDEWSAVLYGRVFLADGNAYFNRPGPRIADSVEILASCLHPKQFREFRTQYAKAVIEVDSDLTLHPWDDA